MGVGVRWAVIGRIIFWVLKEEAKNPQISCRLAVGYVLLSEC